MTALVCIDSDAGRISRWEGGRGKRSQATHRCVTNEAQPYIFASGEVEAFRLYPDSAFYVGPSIPPGYYEGNSA